MPHIDKPIRALLGDPYNPTEPTNMGELTFVLAKTIDNYIVDEPDDVRFQRIGEVLGALESVKAEFIERVHKPYEEHKAAVNGSAFENSEFEIERVTRGSE